MYYVGKLIQGLGLTIILFDYLRTFPELMSRKILIIGIVMFTAGWVLNRYLLKQ